MSFTKVYSGYSGVEYLFEECPESVPPFVVYPGIGEEAAVIAPLLAPGLPGTGS